jgi:molecular chaperone GrpE
MDEQNKDTEKVDLENQSNARQTNASGQDASLSLSDSPSSDSELEIIKKQRDEYLDGWRRTKAEFINYKKDESKRFENVVKYANETIIRELITVLDSFDLALQSLNLDDKVGKGIFLIRTQLEDILKRYGLERISVSVGQKFDPSICDAIAVVESDSPSGTIVDEVEKGYMLNGKLIRAARVKVSK